VVHVPPAQIQGGKRRSGSSRFLPPGDLGQALYKETQSKEECVRLRGTVRVWRKKKGWGVIDSPGAHGGCWALAADIEQIEGTPALLKGERVDFDAEPDPEGRHGCAWRATHIVPVDPDTDDEDLEEDDYDLDVEEAVIDGPSIASAADMLSEARKEMRRYPSEWTPKPSPSGDGASEFDDDAEEGEDGRGEIKRDPRAISIIARYHQQQAGAGNKSDEDPGA
jgi:cold shock CspA family protein